MRSVPPLVKFFGSLPWVIRISGSPAARRGLATAFGLKCSTSIPPNQVEVLFAAQFLAASPMTVVLGQITVWNDFGFQKIAQSIWFHSDFRWRTQSGSQSIGRAGPDRLTAWCCPEI
jgi:hypothetical protein